MWSPSSPVLVLTAAFLLRLGMAGAVYFMAASQNPASPLTVMSQWLSAPDALTYHQMAREFAQYLSGASEAARSLLPAAYLPYPLLLGALYHLLGTSPLWGIALNCLAFAGVGLLAHRLALRLGQPPATALVLAVMAALWPFSLPYSLVLLKDSLILLAVFGLLLGLAALAAPPDKPRRGATPRAALGLGLAAYALTVLRPEFGKLALAASLLGVGWSILTSPGGAWRRPPWPRLVAGLVVAAGVWLGLHASPVGLVRVAATAGPPPAAGAAQSTVQPTAPRHSQAVTGPEAELAARPRPFFQYRRNSVIDGGLSLSDHAFLVPDGPGAYVMMVAAGWRDLLLYPYPWQGPPSGGPAARLGLILLTLAWYACLPGLAWGLVTGLRNRSPAAAVVALWFLAVGGALAFAVVNLGTLLRLRDLVILPALLLFDPRPYAWLWEKMAESLRPPPDSPPGASL